MRAHKAKCEKTGEKQ